MAVSGEKEEETRRCRITGCRSNNVMESIVSWLSLKDAVDTILASPSEWKYLSHSILRRSNIVLDYRHNFGSKYETRPDLGQRMRDERLNIFSYIKARSTLSNLIFFLIQISEYSEGLDEWIRLAITKGVEEIHLRLGYSYVFPHRVLVGSALNLKHLLLENCILRLPPTGFDGFNRLTTLHLQNVYFDPWLMENLFSVCSLLESLTLCTCTMGRSNIVAGDRLTDLKVLYCWVQTKIKVSAPNLASLEYVGHTLQFDLIIPWLSRIYFADTREHELSNLHCVPIATLHLQIPGEPPRISNLPTYGNLKQLNLDINLCEWSYEKDVDVNRVLDLLKAAPLLEKLVILVFGGGNLPETNPREMRNHCRFTNDHLKVVKMQGFKGSWYETALAICILENSPKLEMLVIDRRGMLSLGNGKFCPLQSSANTYMGVVEKKLKGVKTDAQIKFSNCLISSRMPISSADSFLRYIRTCFLLPEGPEQGFFKAPRWL